MPSPEKIPDQRSLSSKRRQNHNVLRIDIRASQIIDNGFDELGRLKTNEATVALRIRRWLGDLIEANSRDLASIYEKGAALLLPLGISQRLSTYLEFAVIECRAYSLADSNCHSRLLVQHGRWNMGEQIECRFPKKGLFARPSALNDRRQLTWITGKYGLLPHCRDHEGGWSNHLTGLVADHKMPRACRAQGFVPSDRRGNGSRHKPGFGRDGRDICAQLLAECAQFVLPSDVLADFALRRFGCLK